MIARVAEYLLPHPRMTISLAVVWCLLSNQLTLGTVVLGLLLGYAITSITRVFWPGRPKLTRPRLLGRYVLLVMWDILIANIEVAKIVVFKRNEDMQPTWVSIPLDLKAPEAITVLAATITLTPGTLSADLSDQGHALLVHALDAPDPDAVRDEIKDRYERRLKEIFE